MHATWCSGMTISGAKSCFGMPGITIFGMVCDSEGRHPEAKKVQKIVDWPHREMSGKRGDLLGLRSITGFLSRTFLLWRLRSSNTSRKMRDSDGRRIVNM